MFSMTLDPDNPNFAASLEGGAVHRHIVHEVHHCLRMAGPGYGWTLGEALVSEGLAGQFAAMRELVEETGLSAGKWLRFLELHLSNSVSDEHAINYLAWDLSEGTAQPDDTEQLQLRRCFHPFNHQLAVKVFGQSDHRGDNGLHHRIGQGLYKAAVELDLVKRQSVQP